MSKHNTIDVAKQLEQLMLKHDARAGQRGFAQLIKVELRKIYPDLTDDDFAEAQQVMLREAGMRK